MPVNTINRNSRFDEEAKHYRECFEGVAEAT